MVVMETVGMGTSERVAIGKILVQFGIFKVVHSDDVITQVELNTTEIYGLTCKIRIYNKFTHLLFSLRWSTWCKHYTM